MRPYEGMYERTHVCMCECIRAFMCVCNLSSRLCTRMKVCMSLCGYVCSYKEMHARTMRMYECAFDHSTFIHACIRTYIHMYIHSMHAGLPRIMHYSVHVYAYTYIHTMCVQVYQESCSLLSQLLAVMASTATKRRLILRLRLSLSSSKRLWLQLLSKDSCSDSGMVFLYIDSSDSEPDTVQSTVSGHGFNCYQKTHAQTRA